MRGRDRGHRARSAWPCSPPRSRWSPSSCRSRFMGGIVGRFMNSFGVTMAFAIGVSLLVTFTLTPMLSSRWLRPKEVATEKTSREHGVYAWIERRYLRAARLVAGAPLGGRGGRWLLAVAVDRSRSAAVANKNFLPHDDESQFEVLVRAPEGTSLEATSTILESVAHARSASCPACEYTLVTIGDDPQSTLNLGSIYVKLSPVGRAQGRPVRDHGRDPQRGPAAVRGARTCARRSSRSPPSAAATTPRSSSGSAAPTSTSSRSTRDELLAKLQAMPGRRRRRHHPDRRQARAAACRSTAPRRPTSACACTTWRRRSTCWSAG